ncbi:hypothetical protein [Flavobacterium sp.]|uniref:hypothetical protein n=1 Tax=Flavobacterium sp. TaxID=239 RepID=UPI0038FBEE60
MALTYTGTKTEKGEYAEIVQDIYADSPTFRGETIELVEGHKSGMEIYESSAEITFSDANYGQVTTDNVALKTQKSIVNLKTFNVEGIIDETSLLGTRFERSMKAGAFEVVSDEFDQKVLIQVQPAVGAKLESWVWNGATVATKASIAALTPGAGQGSITAAAQTKVAAMPTTLFDSVTATMIYNDSQSKVVAGAGLGDYLKVTGTTVTTANIVAEYVKIYNAIPNDVLVMTGDQAPVIFAPKGDYKLIKSVNRVQGVALQENFVGNSFNDMYFNDVKIIFVDLVDFRICGQKNNFKLVMDLLSDSSQLIIEKEANASTRRILKLINTMNTWVVKQKYNVLYNG